MGHDWQAMQSTNAKQRGVKRKEGASVLKRKKRNANVHFTPDKIADSFRACPETRTRCTLLSSPETFLRQIHRTFQSEFPGYMPGPELVAAIVGQPSAAVGHMSVAASVHTRCRRDASGLSVHS